jgi:diguanylate cyclase (GGDEF)-like protein
MSDLVAEQNLILIIDDSVDAIRLLSGMLKDQGQILFATRGETGIRLAQERKPQLILLDVEMPGMSGYEVCTALKADPSTSGCPVIVITAHTGVDSEIAALASGAVDYITKPFNPPIVRARVQTHLRLQQQHLLLIQLANRDGLTGLYNRRYFDGALASEFERHRRQKIPLGLILIDIDHFKAYNDSYGHQSGDECLKRVAAAIGTVTRRPGEVAARYGGEEFVVILPHTGTDDLQQQGEWICKQVCHLNLEHQSSPTASSVTISAGLASAVPNQSDAMQQLIAAADRALYQAKSAGRNRAVMSAPE